MAFLIVVLILAAVVGGGWEREVGGIRVGQRVVFRGFSPPIALPTFCYATAVFGYIHGCCGSLMTMCIVVARVDDDDNVAMIPQHNTVLIHELSEYSPMSGPAH